MTIKKSGNPYLLMYGGFACAFAAVFCDTFSQLSAIALVEAGLALYWTRRKW